MLPLSDEYSMDLPADVAVFKVRERYNYDFDRKNLISPTRREERHEFFGFGK